MITGIAVKVNDESLLEGKQVFWQQELASAVRDPLKLLELLGLSSEFYQDKISLDNNFKLFVPLSYVAKMGKGDWNDPLLRQVLPLSDENMMVQGFKLDPVGDLASEVSSGVLQKYQGRVLLITTGACAVHCRYCFRRHFPYIESLAEKNNWRDTLAVIQSDKSLTEVILSGGDPLMLSDSKLKGMCLDLAKISHIKTLRFHTRLPVFLPSRITDDFLAWSSELPLQKVMVIHANHENELDKSVAESLHRLSSAGYILLNQSVLLKGVNDSAEALIGLSHKLFSMQVLPYYLHQLDKVQGAAHFEVGKETAIMLLETMRDHLPGYLVPRLVNEVSGKRSKQPLV